MDGPSPSSQDSPAINAIPKATGGMIRGAGTGTSDSIPALLSNGEFVVNAKATAQNLPLLQNINSGLPAFQNGGLIDIDFIRRMENGGDSSPKTKAMYPPEKEQHLLNLLVLLLHRVLILVLRM